MTIRKGLFAATIAACLSCTGASAEKIFLKLDGIAGDSTDKVHKDEVEVLSYSLGIENQGVDIGTGAGQGKAVPGEVRITMPIGRALPPIFRKTAQGVQLQLAELSVNADAPATTRATSTEYARYTFTGVIFTGVNQAGTNAPGRPLVEIAFKYKTIQAQTFSTGPTGAPVPGACFYWNLATTEITAC